MGVDYKGNYGIGVEILFDFDESEDFEYMDEYLEHLTELSKTVGLDTDYFEVGEASYSGGENDFYLIIKNPFSDGVHGLSNKVITFIEFLKSNDVDYVGNVDCVGGLNVY